MDYLISANNTAICYFITRLFNRHGKSPLTMGITLIPANNAAVFYFIASLNGLVI